MAIEERGSLTLTPQAWKWLNATQVTNKSLAKVVKRGLLLFQAIFLHSSKNNKSPGCSTRPMRRQGVNPLRDMPSEGIPLAIMDPTLLQCKLESREDVLIHTLQRILRQLMYDQWTIRSTCDMSYSAHQWLRTSRWRGQDLDPCGGREVVLPRTEARRGYVTMGMLFWVKCIRVLDRVVADKEESLLELVMPIPIKPTPLLENQKEDRPNTEPQGKEIDCLGHH